MTLLRRFWRSRRRLYQPSDRDVTSPNTHKQLSQKHRQIYTFLKQRVKNILYHYFQTESKWNLRNAV